MNRWFGAKGSARAMFVISCILLALVFVKLLVKQVLSKCKCCHKKRGKQRGKRGKEAEGKGKAADETATTNEENEGC